MSIKASEDKEVRRVQEGQEDPGDPDLELVRKTKGGDRQAYEELVLRHQRRAFNVAYRILGDYDEALDITQDAFIQAYRSIAGFREESRFSYWLLTITVNLCRNRLRQWKRRSRNRTASIDEPIRCEDSEVRMEIPDPSPSALDNVTARQTEALIREEMMSLEEEFRTVLVLRELQGMSYEEIGTVLGIAAGTVKSRLHRGRGELRDRLRRRLSPPAGTEGAEMPAEKEGEGR
jgi:RNA polymerase sigma-70 factor (ECF subfamily)